MSTVKHICPQMGCREEKTVAVEDLESNKMKKKKKGRKGERESGFGKSTLKFQ